MTLTFPNPIPQGAVLKKYLNNAWQDIPGAQLSGSTATYQVRDGGALDGDGQQNGQVVDPVALLTPEPSYTLVLSPSSLTAQQGGSAQTTLTLTPQNGFTGTVSLSLVDGSGNPVPGITLSPPGVTVSGSAPVTQTLTVRVASSVAPGTYALRVRGTSGSLTREADLNLTVNPSGSPGSGSPGTTWTRRDFGHPYAVTYGNGLFVAVGDGGTVLTSPDGATWTPRASGTTRHLYAVTYGGGLFVAVGSGGVILTSP